jgi:pyruvate-ferredoxin/flavodoxin oxidoreductase
VQEAHDFALIAQAASLKARVPFIHFFDGFRTSHEVAKIQLLDDDVLRALIDDELIFAHRRRALSPEHPFVRGTAQNPDTDFQGRETVNPYYAACPNIVQQAMDQFAQITGRQYKLYEYHGAPDATRVIVLMGSGCETTHETVDYLNARGEKVGLLKVRLYRPFDAQAFVALPETTKRLRCLTAPKSRAAWVSRCIWTRLPHCMKPGGIGRFRVWWVVAMVCPKSSHRQWSMPYTTTPSRHTWSITSPSAFTMM